MSESYLEKASRTVNRRDRNKTQFEDGSHKKIHDPRSNRQERRANKINVNDIDDYYEID